jgi:hypothetical protein
MLPGLKALLPGLIDAVQGGEDHGEVRHGVPELGNVPGHLVVVLTPVQRGGRLSEQGARQLRHLSLADLNRVHSTLEAG